MWISSVTFSVIPCVHLVMLPKVCEIKTNSVVIHLGVSMCKWMRSCSGYQNRKMVKMSKAPVLFEKD